MDWPEGESLDISGEMGGFSEVYASYSKLLEIFADFKIILNELKADSN